MKLLVRNQRRNCIQYLKRIIYLIKIYRILSIKTLLSFFQKLYAAVCVRKKRKSEAKDNSKKFIHFFLKLINQFT